MGAYPAGCTQAIHDRHYGRAVECDTCAGLGWLLIDGSKITGDIADLEDAEYERCEDCRGSGAR
jgi:hypothetical protein